MRSWTIAFAAGVCIAQTFSEIPSPSWLLVPIAIGAGSGSEARRPLGIAIVGGLLFSQVLTLYLTPVFYIYLESFRQYLAKRKFVGVASQNENRVLQKH